MKYNFPTDYVSIVDRINSIDPIQYGKTRNYLDGSVTYLSPYISRGLISTKQIVEMILQKNLKQYEIESFLSELAWRDYFQRIWQVKNVSNEIKQEQKNINNFQIPQSILQAKLGVTALDQGIQDLYNTGYMHNHIRMYLASVVCNLAHSHWLLPAKWMYYHLLDGDWASNSCSWQWVAGSNSNKKYFANEENICRYTHTENKNTFLNKSYEELNDLEKVPELEETLLWEAKTILPQKKEIKIDSNLKTFLYTYYNLDPNWHKEEEANRILILEPSFFQEYPISEKVFQFFIDLSQNITDIQIFVGEFNELLEKYKLEKIYFKEHPTNRHFKGIEEPRDWIDTNVVGYYPSFFNYWKKLKKNLGFYT
jgi:deoxyribodipyrimidine photo-lyase